MIHFIPSDYNYNHSVNVMEAFIFLCSVLCTMLSCQIIYIIKITAKLCGIFLFSDGNIMTDLLKFWQHINKTWDSEAISQASEDNDFETEFFSNKDLGDLEEKEIIALFSALINVVMVVSGIDNYGEIYEMMKGCTSLTDEQLQVIFE